MGSHRCTVSASSAIFHRAFAAALLAGSFLAAPLPGQNVFGVNYFRNANKGAADQIIDIVDPGTNGSGDLCALIYVVTPDEELNECCGCLITPDQLIELGMQANLTGNPANGMTAHNGAVEIISSTPTDGVCDPGTPTPTPELRAWITHNGYDPEGPSLPSPPLTVTATGQIPNPDNKTYIGLNLTMVPSGFAIMNGEYDAWCIDFYGVVPSGHSFYVYDSYGGIDGDANPPLPPDLLLNGQTAWFEVNWLLNSPSATAGASAVEVQRAIWTLLDPYYPTSLNDAVTTSIVNDAIANGASFIPSPGQLDAVALATGPIQPPPPPGTTPGPQAVIITVPFPGMPTQVPFPPTTLSPEKQSSLGTACAGIEKYLSGHGICTCPKQLSD